MIFEYAYTYTLLWINWAHTLRTLMTGDYETRSTPSIFSRGSSERARRGKSTARARADKISPCARTDSKEWCGDDLCDGYTPIYSEHQHPLSSTCKSTDNQLMHKLTAFLFFNEHNCQNQIHHHQSVRSRCSYCCNLEFRTNAVITTHQTTGTAFKPH